MNLIIKSNAPEILILLFISLLAACGGGGGGGSGGGSPGSSSSSPPTVTPTPPVTDPTVVVNGYIVPVVEGLSYSTSTLSGTTDADGMYAYRAGESIEFTLGGANLGAVEAAAELSMFDLAGTEVLTGTPTLQRALSRPSWPNRGLDYTMTHPESRWRPFHAAMNRLFFLASVDRDQDPDNGVQVDPAMAELLVDVQLRFSQNWSVFRELLQIRKARVDGQATGAFDGPLVQLSYPAIMDAAYAALGVDPKIVNMTRQYYFENSGIDYVYNDNDMLIRREGWEDREHRYDAYDNEVWRQDKCGEVTGYSYDAMGNRVSSTSSYFFNTYEYDQYGSLLHSEKIRRSNNTVEESTTVELDELGRPVRTEERSGISPRTWLVNYDDSHNPVRWERRWGDNTDIHVQRFDDKNQLIWRQYLDDLSIQEWQYDARGQVIASTRTYFENDRRVSRDHQTYNHFGRVTRWERHTYGASPSLRVVSRFWNDMGFETRREVDTDGDGIADDITHWERDRGGQVVETRIDSDGDGSPESVEPSYTRYEYDERGNRVLLEATDLAGTVEWRTHYQYDENDNLVLEDEEVGFYGLTTRYTYKPMGWKGIFFGRGRVPDHLLFDYYPCLF